MDYLFSLYAMEYHNYQQSGGNEKESKKIRNEKGISQQKLSDLSGVPKRTIEDIERAQSGNTRVSTAILLADALGVTLDELCRS